jgi:cytochrome P450
MEVLDPIAAVTARDPYPYYARLVADRPFYRDDGLGMWVASSATAVEAVLTSPPARVRPPSEPVPAAIAGTAAGDVFARLVRMNDGPYHATLKPVISTALAWLDVAAISAVTGRCAAELIEHAGPPTEPAVFSAYPFTVPALAIATLIGLPPDTIAHVPERVRNLVRGFAPGAQHGDVTRAAASAAELRELTSDAVAAARTPLTAALAREAARDGIARSDAAANAVGFFSQAYDATAGLIAITLLALASRPELTRHAREDESLLAAVVAEVTRHDAPVQNTRRFAAEDVTICGDRVRAGEAILVIVAAANRDPSANQHPDTFDPLRENRRTYTFGFGPHACPGMALATTIAQTAVARLLAAEADLTKLQSPVQYAPSANTRIPLLAAHSR